MTPGILEWLALAKRWPEWNFELRLMHETKPYYLIKTRLMAMRSHDDRMEMTFLVDPNEPTPGDRHDMEMKRAVLRFEKTLKENP
jgi:hypothetical protein